MSDCERNTKVVRGIYKAMVDRDLASFLPLIADDFTVVQPSWLPYGGSHHGVDGLLDMFRQALRVFDVSELQVRSLVAEGDEVRAVFVIQTRGRGVDVLVSEHWRVTDGKARHLEVSFDDPTLVVEELSDPSGFGQAEVRS